MKHTLQPHEPQEYKARGAYVQLAYAGLRWQLLPTATNTRDSTKRTDRPAQAGAEHTMGASRRVYRSRPRM